jgi:hypothetical protein
MVVALNGFVTRTTLDVLVGAKDVPLAFMIVVVWLVPVALVDDGYAVPTEIDSFFISFVFKSFSSSGSNVTEHDDESASIFFVNISTGCCFMY